jgi:hypothetical protein
MTLLATDVIFEVAFDFVYSDIISCVIDFGWCIGKIGFYISFVYLLIDEFQQSVNKNRRENCHFIYIVAKF